MLSEKKLFLFDIDGPVALDDVLCPERRNSSRKLKSAAGSLYSLPITPPKALRTTSKNSVRWVSQPILRIL